MAQTSEQWFLRVIINARLTGIRDLIPAEWSLAPGTELCDQDIKRMHENFQPTIDAMRSEAVFFRYLYFGLMLTADAQK
jgi:hypothetical protein